VSTRGARTLRGAAFACIATLVAAVAHTLGGGGAPSPLFCAVVAALALPFAVAFAGRTDAAWRTWAAVGVSQLLFHLAFAITGDVGAASAAPEHAHMHAVVPLTSGAVAVAPVDPVMVLAHVLGAIVTALAVRRGETIVRAVIRWYRRALARASRFVARAAEPRVLIAVLARIPSGLPIALGAVTRRGPPQSFAGIASPAL
jgi:hypothetical protein